jgi:hypothetical protein
MVKYAELCTAVGCPGEDVWDVVDNNPAADAWPSAVLLAAKVPPWASKIARNFMDNNPSIPTSSSVGALAGLTAKASTWLHSQKKVWKGVFNNGTTCCHHCFSAHANARSLLFTFTHVGWRMLFVSTSGLADALLMPGGLADSEDEGDERLRHMTAVSAFMSGVITANAEGDCVRREAPDDFDPTARGTDRIREARTVGSTFNPSLS